MSGYGEINIQDQVFKFKFGLNAYQLFCTHKGILLSEIADALGDTVSIIELAYFAHVTEARMHDKQPLMNLTQFIETINDTNTVEFIGKINEVMASSKFLGKTVEEWAGEKKS